jgi:hypothetical protein
MVFEHINDNARHADLSPGSPDLPIVLDTMSTLGALLTPAPKDCRPVIDNIIALLGKATRMMDKPAAVLPDRDLYGDALDYYNPGDYRGNTLLHYDLSASNLLVTRGRVYAIDWSFAARGASWIDGAMLAPRLVEAGHKPVDADQLLSSLPSWTAAPRRSLACLSSLWTLFRLYKALYGPDEVREGRARAAEAGKAWMRYQLAA